MKIDEAVAKVVPSEKQGKYLLLCSFAWMAVAAGIVVISFTLPSIIREWDLSKIEASTLASMTFAGMLVGALTSGFVADLMGRKYAVLLFLSLTVFGTVATGLAGSPQFFGVMRLLSGIGYGGLLPSVNAYLSEMTSIRIRGRYLVYLDMSWAFGSILIGLFSVLAVPRLGWRAPYFAIGIFALLLIPFSLAPETPKYLFLRGGKSALEKAFGVRLDDEIEPIEKTKVPIAALFKGKYLRLTLMVWVVWFIASFVYYGLFVWLPKVFATRGLSEIRSMWFTFFMMVAQIPGYLSVAYLIERTGRKWTLAVYFWGMALSALAFALASGMTAFLSAALVTSFFCLGVWGLLYAYTPELFPTSFRGTANGMAGVMARIAGIMAPYFTGYFLSRGKVVHALAWFAAFSALAGLIVAVFGVETKGRSVG